MKQEYREYSANQDKDHTAMADSFKSMKLSQSTTVNQYLLLQKKCARAEIAKFITDRFEERYLNPIEADPARRNGFAMMAICCLMIESLESFRCGWKDTRNKSKDAFCSFFSHWEQFADFRSASGEFYKHVRCGILHQAETTGGWRIIRTGPIRNSTTVNATRFAASLRNVLRNYASSLSTENWESEIWKHFRTKMSAICKNTKA